MPLLNAVSDALDGADDLVPVTPEQVWVLSGS